MNTDNNMIKGKNSNTGFTLVEAIVSILILSIIVISILNGFATSAKVNLKAREKQYATSLAQNTLEVVKNYGTDQTAAILNGGTAPAKITSTPTVSEGQKYSYTLLNQTEGSKKFDVVISYDSSVYYGSGSETKTNDYLLPDLSTLDSNETAIIDPDEAFTEYDSSGNVVNAAASRRYDVTALDDFYTLYEEKVMEIYSDKIYNPWEARCNEIREANAKLAVGVPPTPLPTQPPDPIYIPKVSNGAVNGIDYYIKRTLDTIVTYKTGLEADAGTDGILSTVDAKLTYAMIADEFSAVFSNTLNQYVSTTGPLYDTVAGAANKDPNEKSTITADMLITLKNIIYTGFYDKISFAKLSNIYLIFKPFGLTGRTYFQNQVYVTTKLEAGISILPATERVDVFIAVQEGVNSGVSFIPDTGILLNVSEKDSTSNIYDFYSQVSLTAGNKDVSNNYVSTNTSGNALYVMDDTTKDRVYDATVDIYEAGKVGIGIPLVTLKTTIVNQ